MNDELGVMLIDGFEFPVKKAKLGRRDVDRHLRTRIAVYAQIPLEGHVLRNRRPRLLSEEFTFSAAGIDDLLGREYFLENNTDTTGEAIWDLCVHEFEDVRNLRIRFLSRRDKLFWIEVTTKGQIMGKEHDVQVRSWIECGD